MTSERCEIHHQIFGKINLVTPRITCLGACYKTFAGQKVIHDAPLEFIIHGLLWSVINCYEGKHINFELSLDFELLQIGAKIQILEEIIKLLIDMECPVKIEPHEVSSLNMESLEPLFQYLFKVKRYKNAKKVIFVMAGQ